jgi:NitT/TauT family transport system permease protein
MNLMQRWSDAIALFDRTRRITWVDLLIVVALLGFLYGLLHFGATATAPYNRTFTIDLSLWALPRYTFFSLLRGLIAYSLSLVFTLVYGYWAAKDHVAERVLVPLLDILQSIPVLGFMPGLVLALIAVFPSSNIGLELAAILMIFTGQAWNMTFSFYHSVRSVPQDQREVATTYRFNWWQLFAWVELPYSTMGLVWNSMMSMAGGWFFLTVSEAFRLGEEDFRLPGIGSYMSMAYDQKNHWAMFWAVVAMSLMIVGLDQLLWRPVVVWAQKFRVEEGGFQVAQSSWFLTFLRRSRLLAWVSSWFERRPPTGEEKFAAPRLPPVDPTQPVAWVSWVSLIVFLALLAALGVGAWHMVLLLTQVSVGEWAKICAAALVTLVRVLVSTALGTLWALPAGLAIGLSPRLSTLLQPVVQVVASFPAPMLFPLVIFGFAVIGLPLDFGSIVLMLLGTQWYILFNVIAGAMAIPADLKEAAHSYNIAGWQKFWVLYFPAVFPYLVTGWVTAAGGAWNASIVAEYITLGDNEPPLQAWGLGALISDASYHKKFALLAASILIMSVVVVSFNRTVWRYCYNLAEKRFSLSK